MPIVDIPSVGTVEFPETMSLEEVHAAAADLHKDAIAKTVGQQVDPTQPARTPEELAIKRQSLGLSDGTPMGTGRPRDLAGAMGGALQAAAGFSSQTAQNALDALNASMVQLGASEGAMGARQANEISRGMLEQPDQPPGTAAKVIAGTHRAALGGLAGMASPEGLAVMATGGAGFPIWMHRLASAAFFADMAAGAPEQAKRLEESLWSGDVEAQAESLADLIQTGAFMGMTGKHAATSAKRQLGRQLAEQIMLNPMEGVTKLEQLARTEMRQPGERSAGPDRVAVKEFPTPEPETVQTIGAQFEQLDAGKRKVVLVTPGEVIPEPPKGTETVETPAGLAVFDPEKISKEEIQQAVAEDRVGDLLDYGIPTKPEGGEDVLTLRREDGVPRADVVVDRETAPQVAEALQKQAMEGDALEVRPAEEAIAERKQGGGMTFEQFRDAYTDAFKRLNQYEPGEVGFDEYSAKMAELADKHPEWADKVEEESGKAASSAPAEAPQVLRSGIKSFGEALAAQEELGGVIRGTAKDDWWIETGEDNRGGLFVPASSNTLFKAALHGDAAKAFHKMQAGIKPHEHEAAALEEARQWHEQRSKETLADFRKQQKGQTAVSEQDIKVMEAAYSANRTKSVKVFTRNGKTFTTMGMQWWGEHGTSITAHELHPVDANYKSVNGPNGKNYHQGERVMFKGKPYRLGEAREFYFDRAAAEAAAQSAPGGLEPGYSQQMQEAMASVLSGGPRSLRDMIETMERNGFKFRTMEGEEGPAKPFNQVGSFLYGTGQTRFKKNRAGQWELAKEPAKRKVKARPTADGKMPAIRAGHWIEWTDSAGQKQQAQVEAVIEKGMFIPGQGAEEPTKEYSTDLGYVTEAMNPRVIDKPTAEPKTDEGAQNERANGQPNAGASGMDVREPAGADAGAGAETGVAPTPGGQEPAGAGNGGPAETGARAKRGRGVRGGNAGDPGAGGRASDGGQPAGAGAGEGASANPARARNPADLNHVLPTGEDWIPSGDRAKVRANLDAIKLLKQLEAEKRNPTPEEKAILARYTGWGGLKSVFDEGKAAYRQRPPWSEEQKKEAANWEKSWGKLYDEVKGALTPEERADAAKSILNAHYTSREIINSVWKAVERLGFRGGKALEPAGGVGHFMGLTPEGVRGKTKWSAVELDDVSGRILEKLYPEAQVQRTGFEKARLPANSQDLVISNVPFAKDGPLDKRYPNMSLHNYFFVRGLDLLKPGGILAAITSDSTMDRTSSRQARELMAERADFIGAIRLPNTAFKKNAGTEVTTDILFFRKRTGQSFEHAKDFLRTVDAESYKGEAIELNEYYAKHPEMMLGRMSREGSMYGPDQQALLPTPGADLGKQLEEAISRLPQNVFAPEGAEVRTAESPTADNGAKVGAMVVKGGRAWQVMPDGTMDELPWSDNATKIIQAGHYIGVRDHARAHIELMNDVNATEADIAKSRAELNKRYDAYVKKYGELNKRSSAFLDDDVDFALALSLEDAETRLIEETKGGKTVTRRETTWSKSKIFTERTVFPRVPPSQVDSVHDAMQVSLNFQGRVNPAYIAELTRQPVEKVKLELTESGRAFENPTSGQWESRAQYLSGFVRQKLEAARAAMEDNPELYGHNVRELEKVQPAPIAIENIGVKLGSVWVPPKVIEAFMRDVLQVEARVSFTPQTGDWHLDRRAGWTNDRNRTVFGIHGLDGDKLVEQSLNLKSAEVRKYFTDGEGKERSERDQVKTLEAQEKQAALQREFRKWVLTHPEAARELETIYNNSFNGVVAPKFEPPTWAQYPGASADITLREHQKAVVTRMVQNSTLLAHAVGTGKTFAMTTAAMEMRRLGLARKPMIVVQNATLEQFARSFKRLYPTARILAPNARARDAVNRNKTMSRIATGDWDAVIIPQSFVNMLPDDPARERAYISDRVRELEQAKIEAAAKEGKRSPKAADLQRAIDRLEKRLEGLAERKKDNVLTFEQLGVDALFVDEAHAYKKLEFSTKMDNIKGLDKGASQRGLSMFFKVRWVQEKNQGRNVVFATGTPVSNTIAEAWNMMRYVRPDVLKAYGIEDFDSFASTFGDTVTQLEMSPGGTWKPVTRFARYQNGPELIAAWRTVADVVTPEEVNLPGLPALKNGKTGAITIPQTERLKGYVAYLRAELERFAKMSGKDKRENSHIPLVVFGLAKKATLDMRMIDPSLSDEPGSKVNRAADEIARIYKESAPVKGAQMVFSDAFQDNPENPRFNLYQELKRKLIERGVAESEIVILTEDIKDAKREALFKKLNDGDVRVAIGSTERMGVGVNAQEHLIGLHHLDAPPRPMDIEQRNGRIVRQGNQNKVVEVISYGVENTLDAAMFQKLATKQKFINQILRGDITGRNFEDAANEQSLSFEEQMAAFSGDKRALEKVALEQQVRQLEALRTGHYDQVRQARETIGRLEKRTIPYLDKLAADAKGKAERYAAAFKDKEFTYEDNDGKVSGRKEVAAKLDALFKELTDGARKRAETRETFAYNDLPRTAEVTRKINGERFAFQGVVPLDGKGAALMEEAYVRWGAAGEELNSNARTGNGFFTSLTAMLERVAQEPDYQARAAANERRNLTELQGFVQQPFEREAELEKARQRLAELTAELEAEGKAQAVQPSGPEAADAGGEESHGTIGGGRGGELGTGPADDRDFTAFPMALPEMVRLARDVMGGRYPTVKRALHEALGRFSAIKGKAGSGKILLRADIADLLSAEEKSQLRVEAEEYAARVADPGDDVAKIAAERYRYLLAQAYEEAKTKPPVLAVKVLAHEIGHLADFLPEAMIQGRGNLFGRIASLKKYMRGALDVDPKDPAAGKARLKEVKEELAKAIAWWRGTPELEDYFKTPEEMYAETFSIFLNNPAALEKRAPKFWELLTNYFERKPEVKRVYDEIQNELKAGVAEDITEKQMLDSWDRAERESLAEAAKPRTTTRDVLDNVQYHFDRRFGPIYRVARGSKRYGNVYEALTGYLYRAAEHELFLNRMNREVGQVLVDGNVDWKDLGRYLFYRRVANERFKIFNPYGVTPDRALNRLAKMKVNLGPASWRALETAGENFRTLYERQVAQLLERSGMFNEALQKQINENVFYATFDVRQEAPADGIESLLRQTFGGNVTGHIYRQVGTVKEIKNPATATVLKALNLISAAHRNMAKEQTVRMLLEQDPANIMPAEQRWTGKRMEPVIKNGDTMGTVVFLQDGRQQAFYVRKVVADALNGGNAIDNTLALRAVQLNNWQKGILTQLNYAFWPVNFLRDTMGWIMQMPGAGPVDWLKQIRPAARAARASVKGTPNATAEKALARQMVISRADPRGVWAAAESEYEAKVASYGFNPAQWAKEADRVHAVVKAWNWYREIGQTAERINKMAAMLYLDEKHPTLPEWKKREIVRERGGSPDFLQRGASNPYVDFVALFYNPWKEGVRSAFKSARENPFTFGLKAGALIVAPSVVQVLAASGAFGSDLEEKYRSIPDYDLSNYLVIPLGWANEDQRVVSYLRLPLWEPARLLHGGIWQGLTGRGQGYVSFAGGQLPSVNPLIGTVHDWVQFEVFNKNPYDSFRGKAVLDESTFQAGGWEARKELLKKTWNDLGGSVLYRFPNHQLESPPQTEVQQYLELPVINNAMGRWVKISNKGLSDEDARVTKPIEQQRAQIRLAVREVVRKIVEDEAPELTEHERLMMREPYAIEYFKDFAPEVMKGRSSELLRRMQAAKSKASKAAILTNELQRARMELRK